MWNRCEVGVGTREGSGDSVYGGSGRESDDRKVALILDQACGNERVGKAVVKLWHCRFLQSSQA